MKRPLKRECPRQSGAWCDCARSTRWSIASRSTTFSSRLPSTNRGCTPLHTSQRRWRDLHHLGGRPFWALTRSRRRRAWKPGELRSWSTPLHSLRLTFPLHQLRGIRCDRDWQLRVRCRASRLAAVLSEASTDDARCCRVIRKVKRRADGMARQSFCQLSGFS